MKKLFVLVVLLSVASDVLPKELSPLAKHTRRDFLGKLLGVLKNIRRNRTSQADRHVSFGVIPLAQGQDTKLSNENTTQNADAKLVSKQKALKIIAKLRKLVEHKSRSKTVVASDDEDDSNLSLHPIKETNRKHDKKSVIGNSRESLGSEAEYSFARARLSFLAALEKAQDRKMLQLRRLEKEFGNIIPQNVGERRKTENYVAKENNCVENGVAPNQTSANPTQVLPVGARNTLTAYEVKDSQENQQVSKTSIPGSYSGEPAMLRTHSISSPAVRLQSNGNGSINHTTQPTKSKHFSNVNKGFRFLLHEYLTRKKYQNNIRNLAPLRRLQDDILKFYSWNKTSFEAIPRIHGKHQNHLLEASELTDSTQPVQLHGTQNPRVAPHTHNSPLNVASDSPPTGNYSSAAQHTRRPARKHFRNIKEAFQYLLHEYLIKNKNHSLNLPRLQRIQNDIHKMYSRNRTASKLLPNSPPPKNQRSHKLNADMIIKRPVNSVFFNPSIQGRMALNDASNLPVRNNQLSLNVNAGITKQPVNSAFSNPSVQGRMVSKVSSILPARNKQVTNGIAAKPPVNSASASIQGRMPSKVTSNSPAQNKQVTDVASAGMITKRPVHFAFANSSIQGRMASKVTSNLPSTEIKQVTGRMVPKVAGRMVPKVASNLPGAQNKQVTTGVSTRITAKRPVNSNANIQSRMSPKVASNLPAQNKQVTDVMSANMAAKQPVNSASISTSIPGRMAPKVASNLPGAQNKQVTTGVSTRVTANRPVHSALASARIQGRMVPKAASNLPGAQNKQVTTGVSTRVTASRPVHSALASARIQGRIASKVASNLPTRNKQVTTDVDSTGATIKRPVNSEVPSRSKQGSSQNQQDVSNVDSNRLSKVLDEYPQTTTQHQEQRPLDISASRIQQTNKNPTAFHLVNKQRHENTTQLQASTPGLSQSSGSNNIKATQPVRNVPSGHTNKLGSAVSDANNMLHQLTSSKNRKTISSVLASLQHALSNRNISLNSGNTQTSGKKTNLSTTQTNLKELAKNNTSEKQLSSTLQKAQNVFLMKVKEILAGHKGATSVKQAKSSRNQHHTEGKPGGNIIRSSAYVMDESPSSSTDKSSKQADSPGIQTDSVGTPGEVPVTPLSPQTSTTPEYATPPVQQQPNLGVPPGPGMGQPSPIAGTPMQDPLGGTGQAPSFGAGQLSFDQQQQAHEEEQVAAAQEKIFRNMEGAATSSVGGLSQVPQPPSLRTDGNQFPNSQMAQYQYPGTGLPAANIDDLGEYRGARERFDLSHRYRGAGLDEGALDDYVPRRRYHYDFENEDDDDEDDDEDDGDFDFDDKKKSKIGKPRKYHRKPKHGSSKKHLFRSLRTLVKHANKVS